MLEKTGKSIPCHCCGAEATQEVSGFPVCDTCAVKKRNELKKEQGFPE